MSKKNEIEPVYVEATSLPDAWFQLVYQILDKGYTYTIDRGSYAGQQRLEFDYVTCRIKFPGSRPLTPQIPPALGIPDPVASEYVDEYVSYLLTSAKKPNEDYTYGERIAGWNWYVPIMGAPAGVCYRGEVNQIERIIHMLKTEGYNTNQACMSIAIPSDVLLGDPPCLRSIDVRVRYNQLHFIIYFRSWDLWNGFPANLAGLQLLKEYMLNEINGDKCDKLLHDGEMIVSSKGLHLYDYIWDMAKLRCGK
jgi:thymidylate synthase